MDDRELAAILAPLGDMDPEAGQEAAGALSGAGVSAEAAAAVAEDGVWALDREKGFGREFVRGMALLAPRVSGRRFSAFRRLVRAAGGRGATAGAALARGLARAELLGSRVSARFLRAFLALESTGGHALKLPLDAFLELAGQGGPAVPNDRALREAPPRSNVPSVLAFLDLIHAVFSRRMPYHQTLKMLQRVPALAGALSPARRAFQMAILARTARAAPDLVRPFLEGLAGDLSLLDEEALSDFADEALALREASPEAAARHLALESDRSRRRASGLARAAVLSRERAGLARYLRARTGARLDVRPLPPDLGPGALSACDGRAVYLAPEIAACPDRAGNRELYRVLAGLEAGLKEAGTFGLDADKATVLCLENGIRVRPGPAAPGVSDLARLVRALPDPGRATDLFTLFEHGRAAIFLRGQYPGFWRLALSYLAPEARRLERALEPGSAAGDLFSLYRAVALGLSPPPSGPWAKWAREFADHPPQSPEESFLWTARALGDPGREEDKEPLALPFGRRIWPHLFNPTDLGLARETDRLGKMLARMGVFVFRSDLEKILSRGRPGAEDLREFARPLPPDGEAPAGGFTPQERGQLDFSGVTEAGRPGEAEAGEEPGGDGTVFWYPEWAEELADYLPDHCRVTESIGPAGDPDFFTGVLESRQGLARKIRRSFELLRPEGFLLLRRWPEGDDFDHRALVDCVVDVRSGRTPSERIYNKRVKQSRDVSALLLVDLSASTKNPARGSGKSVLHVEKEAIVLFCEALARVGDAFGVAGFSGAGRLRADFVRVKDFSEPLDAGTRARIAGMAPMRNTRMGAAIRHGARVLSGQPGRVRLMILLSDGFPNDLDYKGEHAAADVRAAVREARAGGIHVHAITVDMSGAGARLDALYGGAHHNVISDVGELPEKLPRIYRALTAG